VVATQVRVQAEPFSIEEETQRLLDNNQHIGGIVHFVGTVRDLTDGQTVTALELEHYPGMTEAELERVVAAALARFTVEALGVVHRHGHLAPGDPIVLVTAAAQHRTAAFDACRFVIDQLKQTVPFWKREITDQGARWLEPCSTCAESARHWMDTPGSVAGGTVQGHAHPPHASSAHDRGHGTHPERHGHHHHHGHGHDGPVTWNGVRVGILTLSDSRGLDRDKSGDALAERVRILGGILAAREILPDDAAHIQMQLLTWTRPPALDLILTTGGTGPGPRDVTPEATRAVCPRELPGFGELIRRAGVRQVRSAALTRGIAAIRGNTLVINLPGSTRGAVHSLDAVADLVVHTLKMIRGEGH
jgi:molybdopterin synthase catalytic subunit